MDNKKSYIQKRKDVLEVINWFHEHKRKPSQEAKDDYERSLSARLNKYQMFYRGKKGTILPPELLQLLIDEKLITSIEEAEKIDYENKKKEITEIISWCDKNKRKPRQTKENDEERLIALKINNYQKYYRNPDNGTKLPKDLLQILIDRKLITKEEEKQDSEYKKKKKEVYELIEWIDQNKKNPSILADDEYEKKLAVRRSNYQQYYRGTSKGIKLPKDLIDILLVKNIISKEDDIVSEIVDGEKETVVTIAEKLNTTYATINYYYHKYGSLKRAKDMLFYITKNKKTVDKNYQRLKEQFSLNDEQIRHIKTTEKQSVGKARKSILMYDENKTLSQYCSEQGFNYDVIYKKVVEHGLSIEEAIDDYIKNGSKKPTWYIYKKGEKTFKYLMNKYHLDSSEIVKLVKKDYTISEAITYLCIKDEDKNKKLKNYDIDYLYDIQDNFKDENYFLTEIKDVFLLNDLEWNVLLKGIKRAEEINNDLILFDLSLLLPNLSSEEIYDYLNEHDLLNEQNLKIVFFEQATIYDEENYESKRIHEMKRIISSIGDNWKLLEFEDNSLTFQELSLKQYILAVVDRYKINKEQINNYCLLCKKYEEVKKLINQNKRKVNM